MSYEHCRKHDLPATNGCVECDKEIKIEERERMITKIEKQMIADGIDPNRLTLSQAWSYFCFNPDWDK